MFLLVVVLQLTIACDDHELMSGIRLLAGHHSPHGHQSAVSNLSCSDLTDRLSALSPDELNMASEDLLGFEPMTSDLEMLSAGLDFYAYVTPFIIVVGILGNMVALRVFVSRRMRKMSASLYLACLALSDCCALLSYVLVEWLHRGLPRWPGGWTYNLTAVEGLCRGYVFSSYTFRFMSAWFVVAFTIERYIGICMPLRRHVQCKRAFARQSLGAVVLAAVASSLWKPFLVQVQLSRGIPICTFRPGYRVLTFVLDSIYGGSITVVPFVIMLTLNLLICRKLRQAKRRYMSQRFVTEESSIRLEFTAILLLVSTMFILLNVPYFVAYCQNFLLQIQRISTQPGHTTERTRGWIYVTKTIFFCNYCINFFIYSLSGAYFRCQLRRNLSCCLGSAESDRASLFLMRNCQNSQTTKV